MIAKTPDYIITEYGCPQWTSEAKRNEDFGTLFKGYEIINDSNRRLLPLRETLTDYYARTLANRLEASKETKRSNIKQGKKQTQLLLNYLDPAKVKEIKMQRNEALKMQQKKQQHQQQQTAEQQQHQQEYEQQHQYNKYQLPQTQQQKQRYSTNNRSNILDKTRHKRGTTPSSSTTTARTLRTTTTTTKTTTPITSDNDLDASRKVERLSGTIKKPNDHLND